PTLLLCVPPLLPIAATTTFARFGSALAGERATWALPHPPGYTPGELLPGDRDTMIHAHVQTATAIAGDSPFAVVGYSAGGGVAHALVHRLESIGVAPSALVLIDTYLPLELSSRM